MSAREHKNEKKNLLPFTAQSGSAHVGQTKEHWLFPKGCLL